MAGTKAEITSSKGIPSSLRVYPLRLHPGQEILSSLLKFAAENEIQAGFIMTCCGSVTKATLRFAHQISNEQKNERIKTLNEHYEIVSLVGTLSKDGSHHLHISLSDAKGHMIGGHVMGDLNVFTTAEIVIGECTDAVFSRTMDSNTGWDELQVEKRE